MPIRGLKRGGLESIEAFVVAKAGRLRIDAFLSHSSKDKPVIRDIAERLKIDGVKSES